MKAIDKIKVRIENLNYGQHNAEGLYKTAVAIQDRSSGICTVFDYRPHGDGQQLLCYCQGGCIGFAIRNRSRLREDVSELPEEVVANIGADLIDEDFTFAYKEWPVCWSGNPRAISLWDIKKRKLIGVR